MFRSKNSITVYDADDLWAHRNKNKIEIKDILDRLVDNLVSLAEFSEFATSQPELVLTVSPQVWIKFEEAQEYGYLQATAVGIRPNTEYRYMEFKLAKYDAKLIIQEGTCTSALENVQ